MNTVRSVGYGWGVLCLAGGGAYYFAKRSINSDRAERAEAEEKRRQQRERLRASEAMSREKALGGAVSEKAARTPAPNTNNTRESEDPAPVAHAATGEGAVQGGVVGGEGAAGGGNLPRGKFEASEPFRSRKGDRFS